MTKLTVALRNFANAPKFISYGTGKTLRLCRKSDPGKAVCCLLQEPCETSMKYASKMQCLIVKWFIHEVTSVMGVKVGRSHCGRKVG